MPGFCSGQALIGRLHSGFNDYAQEEKVNKRLLIGVPGSTPDSGVHKFCVVGSLLGVPGVLRRCPR